MFAVCGTTNLEHSFCHLLCWIVTDKIEPPQQMKWKGCSRKAFVNKQLPNCYHHGRSSTKICNILLVYHYRVVYSSKKKERNLKAELIIEKAVPTSLRSAISHGKLFNNIYVALL